MFREMRKKARELTKEEGIRILESGEYGVLGTKDENGYPYTTPLSYVWMNQAIYFHCAYEGHKLDNIKNDDRVSFTVVGKTEVLPEKFSTIYESTIVFGNATIIDGEEKIKALKEFINKYSTGFEEKGNQYIMRALEKVCVVKVQVEKISAKGRR